MQKTADLRRKPQKTADFCRNRFLPFAVSLLARSYMWISMLWAGLRGRHMDHPCGGQISPWPARKITDFNLDLTSASSGISNHGFGNHGLQTLGTYPWI